MKIVPGGESEGRFLEIVWSFFDGVVCNVVSIHDSSKSGLRILRERSISTSESLDLVSYLSSDDTHTATSILSLKFAQGIRAETQKC